VDMLVDRTLETELQMVKELIIWKCVIIISIHIKLHISIAVHDQMAV
jgi:hypothetical protein